MANHQDNAILIGDIFMAIKEKYGNKVELDVKNSTDADLFDFLDSVAPDFDREKVYASDVKKMINWFNILSQHMPEAFEKTAEPEAEKTEEV
jgi:ligand-binding sensor protein